MGYLKLYPGPAENALLWGAVASFLLFLVIALAARLASGPDPYSKLNRAHSIIFIPYLCFSLFFAYRAGELSAALLPAILVGGFIYFSLHYVYFFALVGLVKKSISINLLSSLAALTPADGGPVPEAQFLAQQKAVLDFIRRDRLGQMVLLGMATLEADRYSVTRKGRLGNFTGGLILKLWNLRRL